MPALPTYLVEKALSSFMVNLPAQALSLRFNREDGERSRKEVAARRPRRHNGSLWNMPISCAPFAYRSTSA
jgi:hypothetical protein